MQNPSEPPPPPRKPVNPFAAFAAGAAVVFFLVLTIRHDPRRAGIERK